MSFLRYCVVVVVSRFMFLLFMLLMLFSVVHVVYVAVVHLRSAVLVHYRRMDHCREPSSLEYLVSFN